MAAGAEEALSLPELRFVLCFEPTELMYPMMTGGCQGTWRASDHTRQNRSGPEYPLWAVPQCRLHLVPHLHHGAAKGVDHVEGEVYPLDGSVTQRTLDSSLTDRLATFEWDGVPGSGIFEFALSRSSSYTYRPSL